MNRVKFTVIFRIRVVFTHVLRFCELVERSGFHYTDKKENQIFHIYKKMQKGSVAKSYMTNGLLKYGEIFAHFLI